LIGFPSGFHGDFILDNILINDNNFTLIDWRQDFNGSIDAGDMRYDLAKLNHNLVLNHEILANNQYSIDFTNGIRCDVLVKKSLLDCQELLKGFCEVNGISYKKIQLLTSLIWLNMSPLHEHPLDMFLYYFGKYNLFVNLRRN
jgi:aminoglycoside phosphotransferase (APT) family kinase protein